MLIFTYDRCRYTAQFIVWAFSLEVMIAESYGKYQEPYPKDATEINQSIIIEKYNKLENGSI